MKSFRMLFKFFWIEHFVIEHPKTVLASIIVLENAVKGSLFKNVFSISAGKLQL